MEVGGQRRHEISIGRGWEDHELLEPESVTPNSPIPGQRGRLYQEQHFDIGTTQPFLANTVGEIARDRQHG